MYTFKNKIFYTKKEAFTYVKNFLTSLNIEYHDMYKIFEEKRQKLLKDEPKLDFFTKNLNKDMIEACILKIKEFSNLVNNSTNLQNYLNYLKTYEQLGETLSEKTIKFLNQKAGNVQDYAVLSISCKICNSFLEMTDGFEEKLYELCDQELYLS